jgi:hypothetical protein
MESDVKNFFDEHDVQRDLQMTGGGSEETRLQRRSINIQDGGGGSSNSGEKTDMPNGILISRASHTEIDDSCGAH